MEPVVDMKKTKNLSKIERVVLDPDVYSLLEKQLNEFISQSANTRLNLKQFVNHLISKRCLESLTDEEMAEINFKFYDPVLVAKLAYKKALEAKKQGHQFTQDEMIKLYQTQSVNPDLSSKKTRGRKKKINAEGVASGKIQVNNADMALVASINSEPSENQKILTKSLKNDPYSPLRSS